MKNQRTHPFTKGLVQAQRTTDQSGASTSRHETSQLLASGIGPPSARNRTRAKFGEREIEPRFLHDPQAWQHGQKKSYGNLGQQKSQYKRSGAAPGLSFGSRTNSDQDLMRRWARPNSVLLSRLQKTQRKPNLARAAACISIGFSSPNFFRVCASFLSHSQER